MAEIASEKSSFPGRVLSLSLEEVEVESWIPLDGFLFLGYFIEFAVSPFCCGSLKGKHEYIERTRLTHQPHVSDFM